MKTQIRSILCCLLFAALAAPRAGLAQSQLLIQDSPTDTGAEPSSANNGAWPIYESPDIWVRQGAIPNHSPYPYASAYPFTSNPVWLTPTTQANQSPFYRDPRYSQPNYVYVRVHNVGSSASAGTEELHVYWSVAAAGLGWPVNFVDYVSSAPCGGPSTVYGMEITKPRANIATASTAEVNAYLAAINTITTSGYEFQDSVPYWYKQNQVHYFIGPSGNGGSHLFGPHGSGGFFPWHREFINRYEILLREANPTLTLLYWDWHTDPRSWASGLLSTFTTQVGGFSGALPAAFQSVPASPYEPPANTINRDTGTYVGYTSPESVTDATVLTKGEQPPAIPPPSFNYETFEEWVEGDFGELHDYSHEFIGGVTGNMSDLATAAQDPIFFMLHCNVDRLWAIWQRQTPTSALPNQEPYDPAFAFTGSSDIYNAPMAPWNGLVYNGATGTAASPALRPFDTANVPDQPFVSSKWADDPSIVFPPIYDDAPLTIPVLAPGQSVIIEIPWYPPDPNNYPTCFSSGMLHACLLARIVTQPNNPPCYGFTPCEETTGYDIGDNVVNQRGIAWKNEEVIDPPGPLLGGSVLVRNILTNATTIQLGMTLSGSNAALLNEGQIILDLGSNLFAIWATNGGVAQGFQAIGGTQLQLTGTNGLLSNIPLAATQADAVQVELVLRNGYANPNGQLFSVNLAQYDQAAPNKVVGGQVFTFDLNQLSLVPKGAVWRYQATSTPNANWNQVGYNDSGWASGAAKLGYGVGDEATVIGP